MDSQSWVALGALGFTDLVALFALTAFLLGKIEKARDQAEEIRDAANNKMDELHARINNFRDEYVRAKDLDVHLAPLNQGLEALRRDVRLLIDAIAAKRHD
jgi:hypothetical protein